MDLFGDMAAILNSIVSNSYYADAQGGKLVGIYLSSKNIFIIFLHIVNNSYRRRTFLRQSQHHVGSSLSGFG